MRSSSLKQQQCICDMVVEKASCQRGNLVPFHPYLKGPGAVRVCPYLGTFWKGTPNLTEGIASCEI